MTHKGDATAGPGASATPEHATHPRIRIVGMGGSLAAPSVSLAALKVALEGAGAAGADTQVLDLRTLDLPMFLPAAPPPEAVVRFCNAVYAAHSRTRSIGSTS